MSEFDAWIGKTQTVTDRIEPARTNSLSIALGDEGGLAEGDTLPMLHHWLYFWDVKPPAGLGPDGHPAKGGFLPPIPLPRRMWAGGRLLFHAPLHVGAEVRKTSTILSVASKEGRSGKLVFVTVRHELGMGDAVAISEEQDLVYRDAATSAQPLPTALDSAPDAIWHDQIDPDPVLLFRYSALTMNGHRIHYDRPYATAEEYYPALVVHGPLQATLLIRLAARQSSLAIESFSFRGEAPAFDGIPLHVCGTPEPGSAALWTQQGPAPSMTARAQFRT